MRGRPRHPPRGRRNISSVLPALLLVVAAPMIAGGGSAAVGGPAAAEAATHAGSSSSAAAGAGAALPDDAALEASGATFGTITVRALDIFDLSQPGENNFLFRTANRLHITTREGVIRRRILFKEGDPYSGRAMRESERLLRDLHIFYDSRIRPLRVDGNRVDVEVATRDVWTLRFGLGFGRAGGVNRLRIGLEDGNFLGTGKSLTIQRTADVDRVTQLYEYRDPGILGSRATLDVAVSDNSDGHLRSLVAERPFYALDARWAVGVSGLSDDRLDPLYDLGHEFAKFRHVEDRVSAYAGFSNGLVGRTAVRWSAGYTFDRDRFTLEPGEPPPPVLSPNRTFAYPWFGFELVQDGYVTVQDVDMIRRTEDINLAQHGRAQLGWSAPGFGGDRRAAVFVGSYDVGAPLGKRAMVLANAAVSGRRSRSSFENVEGGGAVRLLVRDFGRHLFFVGGSADAAYKLDPDRQILLGGDNGLRGYPLRYQSGDRRYLLTVEQRFYAPWHLLKLVYMGGAVFADVGRCWFAGHPSPSDLGVLRDVGLGLRFQSSRSAHGSMLHVDVAFPLDGDPTIRRVQFLVFTGETF